MTTETLHEPPLPELPPEIAEAVARTVTYANDDESITVIARGDMTLSEVDIQVFPQSERTEIGAQLTSVCSVALDDVQEWTTATLLSSGLIDAETQQLMMGAGPMPESGELPDPVVVTDGVVTDGVVTVVVGPDMRLASITVEHLEDPTAIGPATVRAVNRALLLARGGVEDDLDAQAEQRIAELDAELDKIHSTLDGIDRQLDDIDRSL
jgi:hypothetical protein